MPKKILLAFPIFDHVEPTPFENFAHLLIVAGRLPGYHYAVKVFERQSLTTAMNRMGEVVLQQGFDAAMVFDDDCTPPFDAIKRLLIRCFDEGHPIVAGAGIMRGFPYTTTAAKYYPEGHRIVTREDAPASLEGHYWLDDLPEDLVDVDFCGVPIAIIHRKVFEGMPSPWFGDQDEQGGRMTHDVYFCRKAVAAGFPVKVDGTIRCGHLIASPLVTFENRTLARDLASGQARARVAQGV